MKFLRGSQEKRICRPPGLGWAGILLAIALLLPGPSSAFASSDFTWSGEEAKGSPNWSDAGNWAGGTAPGGSVGSLVFPELTSPACQPATATCYTAENDISSLAVNRLEIDHDFYVVEGSPITIGAGGLKAATLSGASILRLPITLSSPQAWSVEGRLSLGGALSAETDASLAITLVEEAILYLPPAVEVGPLTLSGSGAIILPSSLQNAPGQNTLNGGDGNSVTIGAGVGVITHSGSYELGPLTLEGGSFLSVNSPAYDPFLIDPNSVVSVHGGVTLEPESELELTIVREGFGTNSPGQPVTPLRATGAINIEGAELSVEDATELCACADNTPPTCEEPPPGERFTLISAAGGLTGEFANLPSGALVSLQCHNFSRDARIAYTEHTVTATVLPEVTNTGLGISSATPSINEPVTFTAAVSSTLKEGKPPPGAVTFLDGGQPIPGCTERPLSPTGKFASAATCQLSYVHVGTHAITATFLGGDGYLGSSSQPEIVGVRALPAALRGSHLRLMRHLLKTRHRGSVQVTLDCAGQQPCSGVATLTVKRDMRGAIKTVKIADTAGFSIAAGKSLVVVLKLNPLGRTLVRRHGSELHADLRIRTQSGVEHDNVVLPR